MTTANRESLVALDKRYVWHPYTEMQRYIDEVEPLVVARAEGARFFDVNGKSYIDANSSWWVSLLGHRHPRLVQAMRQQSEQLCHVALAGITHEPAARLAEELCRVAPAGLDHVFYSDDGSTSVEVAIKLALQFWHNQGRSERKRFVALDGAFHGDTIGATGLGGVEVFRRPFAGVVLECVHVPSPGDTELDEDEPYRVAFEAMAQLLREQAATIAAVIVEPLLQGAAGMRIYDPRYLSELRSLCDELDVLLIVDEVFTGYGRTGTMWACDQASMAPDILCMAKGFSGGMFPMAATLATTRIFDAFLGDPKRAFYYGHTYCGNPLGAAVAREVLAVYRDEEIIEHAQPKAVKLADCFRKLSKLGGVKRWRGLGMAAAIDLDTDGGYLGRGGWRIYDEALARGAYLRPLGDTVYAAPPLNIPDSDLDELIQIIDASVRAVID